MSNVPTHDPRRSPIADRLRDLLRHGTTTMTEKYIHGIDPRLVEAQNMLVNAILNAPSPSPGTPKTSVLQMPARRSAG